MEQPGKWKWTLFVVFAREVLFINRNSNNNNDYYDDGDDEYIR